MRWRSITIVAVCGLLSLRASAPTPEAKRSTTLRFTADGSSLLVANPDSGSVTILDAVTRTVRKEIGVCGHPKTIAASEEVAYVACGDGQVIALDPEAMAVIGSASAGIELFGIVHHDGRLVVSDHAGARILILDAMTLSTTAVIATEPWPRGLAIQDDVLYVTHFRSGRISVIDLETLAVERVLSTGIDNNLSQAIVIHGGRAYLPQTRSNSSNPALLFDTTVFPVVSVVDLATGENLQRDRFSIDVVDRPVNMPLDAAITASGKMYVVNAGSDDVSVIDLTLRKSVAHIAAGRNPQGIALSPDQHTAFVHNALSADLSVINTATDTLVATIPVTTLPLSPAVLNGKILFHSSASPKLSKDRWISCATCHPDGGADGRTWFFRDGPRNTTSLFGVLQTLPLHWSGDLDELQDVEQTVRVIQAGTGLTNGELHCTPTCDQGEPHRGRSADLDDLAAFMATLRPPRRVVDASEAAERGREIFLSGRTDCSSCHPSPMFTDRKRHDVGTGSSHLERKGSSFDTPALRGLTDTAPYFHDGSAATLADVLVRHGDVSALNAAEREDLVAFLRSLPFPQLRRRAAPH